MRCFLEFDVQYPEELYELHNDLSFLPERTKIGKTEKGLANFYDKKEHVIQIKTLKKALTHGLVFKKVHRFFNLKQKTWLKLYIDMNTELEKKAKENLLAIENEKKHKY